MKLERILTEASYPGNIGAMEVFKFYQMADQSQRDQFDQFMKDDNTPAAWDLIKDVTGMELQSIDEYERFSDPITSITVSKKGSTQTYRVLNDRPVGNDWQYYIKTMAGDRWVYHDTESDKLYAYTGKNDREIVFVGEFVSKERKSRLAMS